MLWKVDAVGNVHHYGFVWMHGEVDAVAHGLKHGCSGKWVPSGIGSYSNLILDWIRDGRLVGLGVDAPGHECGFGA